MYECGRVPKKLFRNTELAFLSFSHGMKCFCFVLNHLQVDEQLLVPGLDAARWIWCVGQSCLISALGIVQLFFFFFFKGNYMHSAEVQIGRLSFISASPKPLPPFLRLLRVAAVFRRLLSPDTNVLSSVPRWGTVTYGLG